MYILCTTALKLENPERKTQHFRTFVKLSAVHCCAMHYQFINVSRDFILLSTPCNTDFICCSFVHVYNNIIRKYPALQVPPVM